LLKRDSSLVTVGNATDQLPLLVKYSLTSDEHLTEPTNSRDLNEYNQQS